MRTARSVALVALALAAVLPVAATAGASAPRKGSLHLATEVCESMVRDAVEASLGRPLAAAPVGGWVVPRRQYRCSYDVGGGSLVLTVDVGRSTRAAKTAFRAALTGADVSERLHGIGKQAFQAKNGELVARKDRFVLTADPAALPADASKKDLTFAAAVAVMSCWPG